MAESVARTAQPALSQTSLDLPAEQSNAGRVGQHLHLLQLQHHEPDQDPVRRAARGTSWSYRGFRSDTPAGLWSLHHLAKTRPGQDQGVQGEEELQGAHQQTVGQGQAPAHVSVWEFSERGSI